MDIVPLQLRHPLTVANNPGGGGVLRISSNGDDGRFVGFEIFLGRIICQALVCVCGSI